MISRSCPAPRSSSAVPPIIGRWDGSPETRRIADYSYREYQITADIMLMAHSYGANCELDWLARGDDRAHTRDGVGMNWLTGSDR